VPHAGELGAPDAIRDALDLLHADRLRHGIRAIEDAELVQELKERGTVLDVCPASNVHVGVVPSMGEHPLPKLVEAGVLCSLSTDDPPMFDTDLTREYAAACSLGLHPKGFYDAGVAGALCDEQTKARLAAVGEAYDWSQLDELADREAALG
jgi:aminodeoxyfutalosine deaminase